MARSLTAINDLINSLQDQLNALQANFQVQRNALRARIDQLRAIKARITPEIEAVIVDLDNELDD